MILKLYSLLLTAFISYQTFMWKGDNGNSFLTTSEEIVDTFGCPTVESGDDYTVAVTGATSGIGEETARHLLGCGARVFVGGRSDSSVAAAIGRLAAQGAPTAKAVPWVASLSSVGDAVRAGEALVNAKLPIHALVLNAGVMGVFERTTTSDNLETMMAVNHVAHAALTRAARPAFRPVSSCEKARLVVVSSAAHSAASAEFVDDPNLEATYGPWVTYGDTKMANVLFARGVSQHWPEVTAVSLHPGGILTNLSRHADGTSSLPFSFFRKLPQYGVHLFKTVSEGASTTLYTLLAPEVASYPGAYFENAHLSQPFNMNLDATDPTVVAKLWKTTWDIVDRTLATYNK